MVKSYAKKRVLSSFLNLAGSAVSLTDVWRQCAARRLS